MSIEKHPKKTFMGSVGRLRHADFGILWPWSLIWLGPWVQCLTPDGLLKRFFKALVGDASEITKATDRLWNSNQVSLGTWRKAPTDPPTSWDGPRSFEVKNLFGWIEFNREVKKGVAQSMRLYTKKRETRNTKISSQFIIFQHLDEAIIKDFRSFRMKKSETIKARPPSMAKWGEISPICHSFSAVRCVGYFTHYNYYFPIHNNFGILLFHQ